jgi:hypothetical protein
MKSEDPIKLDSKKSFTPSVAAFFAQAKAQEEATTPVAIPLAPRTPKRCSLPISNSSPAEKNLLKTPTKPATVHRQEAASKTPTGNYQVGERHSNFSKTQPEFATSLMPMALKTPQKLEKYAGSSFHKSPAAHTLPIPKFASGMSESGKEFGFESEEIQSCQSLPSSLMLASNRDKLEESQTLFKLFAASTPKKTADDRQSKRSPTKSKANAPPKVRSESATQSKKRQSAA